MSENVAASGVTMPVEIRDMGFAWPVADRMVFMDRRTVVDDAFTADPFTQFQHERSHRCLRCVPRGWSARLTRQGMTMLVVIHETGFAEDGAPRDVIRAPQRARTRTLLQRTLRSRA